MYKINLPARIKNLPTVNGKSPYWKLVFLTTLVALPLLVFNLYGLHQKQAYISDDTIQQLIVGDWQSGQPRDAVLGEDTFALKMPFYAVLNKAADLSPQTLFFTCALMLVIMLLLFNIIQFTLHRSLGFGTALSLLLASWGGYVLFWLRTPNLRNLELTLAILTGLAIVWWWKRRPVNYITYAFLILAVAVQAFNDPYVLYVVVAPLFMALVITSKDRLKALKFSVASFLLIAIVWKVILKLAGIFGIATINQHIKLPPSPGAFFEDILDAFEGLSWVYGNKQIDGSLTTNILSILSLAVMLCGLVYVIRCFIKYRQKLPDNNKLAVWFGLTIIAANVAIYIVSGLINQSANHRYLIATLFGWLLVMAAVKPIVRSAIVYSIVSSLIILHIISNIAWTTSKPNVDNLRNTKVIENFMANNNTQLGFSDYWDGNINTYMSNREIRMLPMLCSPDNFSIFEWATNLPNFPDSLDKARFVIFLNTSSDSPTRSHYPTNQCALKDIEKHFSGRIEKVETLDSSRTLILVGNT